MTPCDEIKSNAYYDLPCTISGRNFVKIIDSNHPMQQLGFFMPDYIF